MGSFCWKMQFHVWRNVWKLSAVLKYMQKRWENFCGRVSGVSQPEAEERHGGEEKGDSLGSEECPEWGHVIQLLVKFISPVVDATLRDELFIGDWMPQFGRYLG